MGKIINFFRGAKKSVGPRSREVEPQNVAWDRLANELDRNTANELWKSTGMATKQELREISVLSKEINSKIDIITEGMLREIVFNCIKTGDGELRRDTYSEFEPEDMSEIHKVYYLAAIKETLANGVAEEAVKSGKKGYASVALRMLVGLNTLLSSPEDIISMGPQEMFYHINSVIEPQFELLKESIGIADFNKLFISLTHEKTEEIVRRGWKFLEIEYYDKDNLTNEEYVRIRNIIWRTLTVYI